MLEKLSLDKSLYRVGLTKVFFRAGVLAELEEQRDALISEIMARFQAVARGYIRRRSTFKKLYRTEATRVIQRNFNVYLDLSDNPWWQLLIKMKPLLGATRTAIEVKRRDQEILQLNEKMKLEAENRTRLEEERRNCHAELVRTQQVLESERALALDKEEIFKRLQAREAELEDELQGAMDDQEKLEDQLDDLLEAKKRAEQEVDKYRSQLEQAAALISRLEQEKSDLDARAGELEGEIEQISQRQADRSAQEAALEDEIKMLQSQLSLKERKTKDLEAKLLKIDQDAGVKLLTTQKELQTVKAREQVLSRENRDIQQQLTQLSQTSTDFDALVRKKESELAVLRGDVKNYQFEQRKFEEQRKSLTSEREKNLNRLHEVQAEMSAMKSQHSQLQREAEDAKRLLEARLSEDAQANENRQVLEAQIKDLKDSLYKVQTELSRERQSRDDVALLSEHKFQTLKEEHEQLKELKITIEKELYLQQDTLRRTKEARATAERERDEAREEIRKLRAAKSQAEEARMAAEERGERNATRAAREREASLQRDLDATQERLGWFEAECDKLNHQIEDLNKFMIDSGEFGLRDNQAKERLERELVTVKGRLTASENDNRALLNKLQQKGLEIARSSSRANEASRGQVVTLQREKARVEEQNVKLNKQLGDSQLTIAGLEKKVEKLQLNLEDLNHEIAREVTSNRNAEKNSSNFSAQLAEANRTLESERQVRSQAQSTVRTMQATLDSRGKELEELRTQMLRVLKAVDPEISIPSQADGSHDSMMSKNFEMIRKIEELQQNLRVQTAARATAESQVAELRASRADTPSRPQLGEIPLNEVGFPGSPTQRKSKPHARQQSNTSTPMRSRGTGVENDLAHDSDDSEHSSNVPKSENNQHLKSEIEDLQSQLQIAKMQNRNLQNQLDRSGNAPREVNGEGSPSDRRVLKLEQANSRLHDMLDDSAKKLSVLERSIQSGDLSLRDIQTRSHEEILELLNSQEDSRRSLLRSHNDVVAEITDIKEHFERIRRDRASLEVELRDAKSDLQEMSLARDQEASSRTQLLQEYADLQISLDAETSKLADVTSSLHTYKTRADEYFSKLEQAEIAVLKATRAEQFAKSQAQEAEDTYAEIISTRDKTEALIEDLQRQNQRLEEKLEDLTTDHEAATQAKKRLQHELEDYRSQRAIDLEDKEASMEQTRKKYQAEFATLTKDLDLAREEKLYKQSEITRLREELDDLRSKWDDEVLNSSTWSKEKSRLDATLADVMSSRDEAVNAHSEAQAKVVNLLSQVRSLRSSVDDITVERDALVREKRSIETRLEEAKAGLEDLANSESPALRNAANTDKEILELKSALAQNEDITTAAVEKMRRSEALSSEVQKELAAEREIAAELSKQKAALEKSLNEVQLRVVDLETKGYSTGSQDIKFLHKRIQELENQLETQEDERNKTQRSARNIDRTVKDLQTQIERKDKQAAQLNEDTARLRDKVDKLLKTIDELQSSESDNQLQARRAERELREEKERAARLEREVEGWRALRGEKGNGSVRFSMSGVDGRRMSTLRSSVADGDETASTTGSVDVPQRKSSLNRAPSLTKGFL